MRSTARTPRPLSPARSRRTPVRGAVVLVTGAASGIGALVAVQAAHRGARAVVLWDLDLPAAQDVATRVQAAGATCLAQRVDLRDAQEVEAAGRVVLERLGRVDVLVNSAGVVTGRRFEDLSEEDVARTFDVNVLALYRVVRCFLPGMRTRDRGCVVTIASAAGLVGVARQTDYSASKFAAVGFMESLRSELRRSGSHVRTLVVAPYYVSTGMFAGVRTRVPLLLPVLEPGRVASQVLDSVERGDARRILPWFANAVLLVKALPVPVADAVTDLFGISTTMDTFTGRSGH
ncbi:SDR family oxidoreductase [Actinomyces sp. oral taxon 897]|uniref:SDR family oxidoreductase n=1 Tax=Actinomyces sp. oral taxon 897 TaxID=2081702 RepID=UPI000D0355FE|nr:SDR family oxidoreductase [Actinomyces sp. oral taxon 897]AVM61058.1 short-chain dehydrogenase [Actinomyces sp. oral taxon 897]